MSGESIITIFSTLTLIYALWYLNKIEKNLKTGCK